MGYVYMYEHLPALFFFLFRQLTSEEINLTPINHRAVDPSLEITWERLSDW